MKKTPTTRTTSDRGFRRHSAAESRTGYAMLLLMMTAAVMSLIGISLFRTIQVETTEANALNARCQATLLAESGLEQAIAQLRLTPSFRGNLPTIDANQLRRIATRSALLNVAIRDAGPDLVVIDSNANVNGAMTFRQWQIVMSRILPTP